jgi:hypothetical protein
LDINGRNAGLYVLAQAANRDFLSDTFRRTKGNFYEGTENDVTEKLRLDSGSGKDDAGIRKLIDAVRDGDPNQRFRRLVPVLDMDRFVSFLAAEVFTWNRDGYSLKRDNYRIYHDPVSDKLVFMPDGLDELFGKPNGPLVPEIRGVVSRAIVESGAGLRLYRERMAKLLGTAFKVERLHQHIQELAGKIRPTLARDPNELKAFDNALAQLREAVATRVTFLQEELKKPAK